MSRARIRTALPKEILKLKIENIQCDELREIGTLYYLNEKSQIDIAFDLNYSERTINNRIHELKDILER